MVGSYLQAACEWEIARLAHGHAYSFIHCDLTNRSVMEDFPGDASVALLGAPGSKASYRSHHRRKW